MAKMDTVIQHLRRVTLRQDRAGRTDGQLLASFIDHKDEAAFEALVRRHGPMVFGVCRRLLNNHHDAEDAFQSTFLVLALKAPSVRPRERVANWLHGVALRTAMKAKAMTAKRRGREKQVTEMPEPKAAQQDQWRDLQPLLDQELNGLPESYRLPILLCDLEGKTIKDAAQQLGWPQGSLAGRLARGRKLLAKRLVRRGVALSAGSLAVILSQNAVSAAAPTSLMSTTVKAATMIAAGQATIAGLVSCKVATLTEGVLKAMFMTKIKSVVTVTLAMAVTVGIGAGLLSYGTAAGQQSEDRKAVAVAPQKAVAKNGKEAGEGKPKTGSPTTSGRMYEFRCDLIEGENEHEQRVAAPTLTAEEGKSVKWSLGGVMASPERVHLIPRATTLSVSAKKLADGRLRLRVRFQKLGQKEVDNDDELRVVRGTNLYVEKTVKPREEVTVKLNDKDDNTPGTQLHITVVPVSN